MVETNKNFLQKNRNVLFFKFHFAEKNAKKNPSQEKLWRIWLRSEAACSSAGTASDSWRHPDWVSTLFSKQGFLSPSKCLTLRVIVLCRANLAAYCRSVLLCSELVETGSCCIEMYFSLSRTRKYSFRHSSTESCVSLCPIVPEGIGELSLIMTAWWVFGWGGQYWLIEQCSDTFEPLAKRLWEKANF